MADFSERLRQLRIQKGISQQELADVIHVNKQTISGYERGIRRPAGENAREIYERLADFFNVDTTFLMGLTDVTVTLSNPLQEPAAHEPDADSRRVRLLQYYEKFNEEGKERLLSYAQDLDASGRYKETQASEDAG